MPRSVRLAVLSRRVRHSALPLAIALCAGAVPRIAPAQNTSQTPEQAAEMLRRFGYDPAQVYAAFQVQQPARLLTGSGPTYPAALKAAGTQGDVILAFVVDTTGSVAPGSVHVLRSDHGLFTEAARTAVVRMRFEPARLHGQPVPQMVQQPFQFRLPYGAVHGSR